MILSLTLFLIGILGQTYTIYIIVIAGAEPAICLSMLVAFYRLRGTVAIEFK